MKTLQVTSSSPRKRGKRRHYDQAFKRHVVELTLVPGASVARIALDHRINANIVFRWRRHYLGELGASTAKPAALLPVRLAEASEALEIVPNAAPVLSRRGRHTHERTARGVIEVELALGQVRVTGSVELEALRLVLEALSHK